jgi:hypothetical protein
MTDFTDHYQAVLDADPEVQRLLALFHDGLRSDRGADREIYAQLWTARQAAIAADRTKRAS